jgi:predicted acylesterase/phospholipase RssA
MHVEPSIVAMSINGIGLRATRVAQVTGALAAAGTVAALDKDDRRQFWVAGSSIGAIVAGSVAMAGSAATPERLRYLVDGSESISTVARQNVVARGAMRAGLAGAVAGWGGVVGMFAGAMLNHATQPMRADRRGLT